MSYGSAARAAEMWAGMVLISVAPAVLPLPLRIVDDYGGWVFDLSEPLAAVSTTAVIVGFIHSWAIATVVTGVGPVVLVVAFRVAAWKDAPGPIGPIYTAFIAAIAVVAAAAGAIVLLHVPWSSLPALGLILVAGFWAEKRIGGLWKGTKSVDEPVERPTGSGQST